MANSQIVIPGVLMSSMEASIYSKRLCAILESKKFIGAQPISFEEKHSQVLLEKDYFVSEKADGIRLFLYSCLVNVGTSQDPIYAPQMILIDRKNDYYKIVDFGFPKNNKDFLADTIVDGELIYDKTSDGRLVLYYLAFDALMVDGKSLVNRPYTSRLGYLRELVLKPYLEKVRHNPYWKKTHSFEIRQKKVEPSYHLDRVFKQIQGYKHESDGLIFTSADDAYHFGTCETMIKWKPPSENTVDFLLHVSKNPEGDKYSILINYGKDGYKIVSDFVFGPELEKLKGQKLNGRIIECKYDTNWPFYWKFSRFRDDKAEANHSSTFIKVKQSIQDNVTQSKLLDMREQIELAWKGRDSAKKTGKRSKESVDKESKKKAIETTQEPQIQKPQDEEKQEEIGDSKEELNLSEKQLLSVDFD